ncbi:hypothetical protein ACFPRL_09840 [Pseudoclavibacter helvolus]
MHPRNDPPTCDRPVAASSDTRLCAFPGLVRVPTPPLAFDFNRLEHLDPVGESTEAGREQGRIGQSILEQGERLARPLHEKHRMAERLDADIASPRAYLDRYVRERGTYRFLASVVLALLDFLDQRARDAGHLLSMPGRRVRQ